MSLHVINLPEPTHSVAPLGKGREERRGEERSGAERREEERRADEKRAEERRGQERNVGWMQVEDS